MTQTATLKNKKTTLSQGTFVQNTTKTVNSGGNVYLTYYGARYLDPKTSRWLSTDPALGEYVPVAPLGDNERKHNGNLPGMGGVFNLVNLHVYHYAGNNPVKYVDPDGREGGMPEDVKKILLQRETQQQNKNIPIPGTSNTNQGNGYVDGNIEFSHYQFSHSFIEGLGINASYSVNSRFNIVQNNRGDYVMNISVNANSIGASNVGNVSYFGSVTVKIDDKKVCEYPLTKHNSLHGPDFVGYALITLPPPEQNLNLTIRLEVNYLVKTTSGAGGPLPWYNRNIPIYKVR